MKYVHTTCLQNWIATSSRLTCEVCVCKYRGRKLCKYGVLTSIMPYLKARWYQPQLNFSLLFLYLLAEQTFLGAKEYYRQANRYRLGLIKKCDGKLFLTILWRWIDYILCPRSFFLLTMAFRDWSAWRKTQIVFVLDRW